MSVTDVPIEDGSISVPDVTTRLPTGLYRCTSHVGRHCPALPESIQARYPASDWTTNTVPETGARLMIFPVRSDSSRTSAPSALDTTHAAATRDSETESSFLSPGSGGSIAAAVARSVPTRKV